MTSRGLALARAAVLTSLCILSANAASQQPAAGECSVAVAAPEPADALLFSVDGTGYRHGDLPAALQQAMFDARVELYNKQVAIIDAAVLDVELDRRSRESGKARADIERELFTVAPPAGDEIEAFYRQNRERIPYPLEAVRDRLGQMIVQQKVQARQAEVVASLKRNREFELALARPLAPFADIVTDGMPQKGAPDAAVTIVEFADYQCPHCQRAAAALQQIAERYGDRVRIVFKDFPVNPSGISRVVAEGAVCADRQQRFWPYHDLAFERQSGLTRESPAQIALELELDMTAFEACMKSPFPRERVARSEAEAKRLGLTGTPTIFLNGRRLRLQDFGAELTGEIERALARAGDA